MNPKSFLSNFWGPLQILANSLINVVYVVSYVVRVV